MDINGVVEAPGRIAMVDDPTGESYDRMAAEVADSRGGWASPWGDNPLQEHYSWPATRDRLPVLDDRRVLDAGCGIGDHVPWLVEAGATVVGVDASVEAVDRARDRFDDRATFRRADLGEPLPSDGGAFDVVCSHLVLDHVADLRTAFAEFHRVLAPGGVLVFTVIHPIQYYLDYDAVERYYDETAVEVAWPDAPVTSYYRPVGDLLDDLLAADFRLDAVAEPEPPAEYLDHARDRWNVDERPQILCVRARRPDREGFN